MKSDYMARLSRAARWRLPQKEAQDVIADYQDMIGTPPRPNEELLHDLGQPVQAVKLLTQPKTYYVWLAVFGLLSACLILPALIPLKSVFRFFWAVDFSPSWLWATGLPIGILLSLFWFRRYGEKTPSRSKLFWSILIVLLAVMAGVWWLFEQICMFPSGIITQDPQLTQVYFGLLSVPANHSGLVIQTVLVGISVLAGVLGMIGLVKARMCDRRWLAAYLLALTLTALNVSILTFLTNVTFDYPEFLGEWQAYIRMRNLIVTLIGLVGAGVALC